MQHTRAWHRLPSASRAPRGFSPLTLAARVDGEAVLNYEGWVGRVAWHGGPEAAVRGVQRIFAHKVAHVIQVLVVVQAGVQLVLHTFVMFDS